MKLAAPVKSVLDLYVNYVNAQSDSTLRSLNLSIVLIVPSYWNVFFNEDRSKNCCI